MQRRHRIRTPGDFQDVLDRGASVVRPGFVLYHLARTGRDEPRFGFVVSRRVGGAVVRNHVKRLLREAARQLIPRVVAPVDVVVVARGPITQMAVPDLHDALESAAAEAGLLSADSRPEDTSTESTST